MKALTNMFKKWIVTKKILIFLTIFILTAFLYKDTFSSYYFQDDWFAIRISSLKSISNLFSIFVPRSDVIYYRPLGMQIPFYFITSLFGFNSFPFHILIFLTHCINIIQVYILIKLLNKREDLSLFAAFLYGTSTIHYIPFYWPATFAFVIGPGFFFAAFSLFINFINKNQSKYFIISLFLYLIGLFTNEMVVILPVILLTYCIFTKNNFKKSLYIVPFFILALIIFGIRYLYFPPPTTGYYELEIGKSFLNNLKGYIIWSFNWPEEMKAQLVKFLFFNVQFIKEFKNYFYIFVFSLVINISTMFIIPFLTLVLKRKFYIFPKILFGLLWYLIGLTTVIYFPKHSFSYYLPISFVGLMYLFVSLYNEGEKYVFFLQKYKTVIYTILLVNWLIVGFTTINFNKDVHWAPRRANISRKLVSDALSEYSQVRPPYKIFVESYEENYLALNNQDAFRVVFNSAVKTIYSNEK